METASLIWKSAWDILLVLIGLILMFMGIKVYIKQQRIIKTGIKTIATVIGFSNEKSLAENEAPVKIPLFIFYDTSRNQISVKGKSNSICTIHETTPIYYNPAKPETEYYLPKKDFLVKFLFFFVGLFFLSLGIYYLRTHNIVFDNFYIGIEEKLSSIIS
ncbi:DUF3592 domain-containing protein [Flavobacterium piscisymbiosum]|uniref:DUF3592 domain-containing protein n=1 Tax=Flavobacterium piscisymbiosum TaxID=2893753 RepID=A0ABS8ME64_9FLAO|nr:DUF3592 domain-containing protein [Flavobacterium sp. F-30]MCC9063801.1 hypothetical protein [Flavobacterium sp. F-30]